MAKNSTCAQQCTLKITCRPDENRTLHQGSYHSLICTVWGTLYVQYMILNGSWFINRGDAPKPFSCGFLLLRWSKIKAWVTLNASCMMSGLATQRNAWRIQCETGLTWSLCINPTTPMRARSSPVSEEFSCAPLMNT